MKLGRSIAAHAILAVGGLVLAYLAWTDEAPEVSEDEVNVLECAPDALARVELRTEEKDVTLEMRSEGSGRVAWFTVVRRPENGEPVTESFVGASEATTEWLAQVAPLRARRSLGELSAEQLEQVELDDPEGRLTIDCGGRSTTYQLGGRSYGTGDRYLRAEGGGPVYLVASDRLAPLESAEFRLMERALHTFEWRDVVSLSLRAFGQSKRLLQHNRLDEQAAEWVDAANPDRRDETYGNWMSRFPRLRVQSYLAPDARPGADLDEGMSVAPQAVMRIDYQGEHGSELGFLEMQRAEATPAYYARTETTRSWVRVPTSVAQQIEEDLRSMLGVAPLERPAQPAPAAADAGAPAAPDDPASPEAPSPHDHAHD
ncbi:MAG: DUF4340 domain-containing protein [Sandaracinaceae bacterium]|nr:DUF4340 domain-containing protein [Sandaracinaceae bacterium]